jgi:hypothetical protein
VPVIDVRAYLALLLFIPLSLVAFAGARRPVAAFVGVYMGGILFLPEHAALDFPLVPPMDKNAFAALMGLAGSMLLMRRKLAATRPFQGAEVFFVILVIGIVGTILTNQDPQVFGQDIRLEDGRQIGEEIMLPGMVKGDILAYALRDLVAVFLPFYLGRALFRTREDARILLKGTVIIGLIYLPLMLFEMRMSPQLHNWVYGYHANLISHAARGDGFKPTVFLNNGLAVAMFMLAAIVCAAAMFKAREKLAGVAAQLPMGGLWLGLVLSRNLGATVYSLAAVPAVLVSSGKMAGRVAMILVAIVLAYPALRATQTLPVYDFVEFTSGFSPERAQSMNTRFTNEDALFERARERIWFGWGGYGRNRVYNEFGKDVSITDGEWVIRIGGRGIIGFIGFYGMLLFPVVLARRRMKKIAAPEDRKIIDALCLLCALNAVDLLPNGMFNQLPFLWAGALAGLSSGLSQPLPPR